MTEIQLGATGGQEEITLAITYPNIPNLSYNFKLTIEIFKQQIGAGQLHNIIKKDLYIPEKSVVIKPMQGGQIYKVQCSGTFNGVLSKKTVFAFVSNKHSQEQNGEGSREHQNQNNSEIIQQQINRRIQRRAENKRQKDANPKAKIQAALCRSQDLMKMCGRSVGIVNQKKLDRFVLESRKCKNTKQFLNSRKEHQTGNHQRLIQKQQMLLKGKMVLNQVYHSKEGMNFFKNDWFMGPFYSYDHNQQQLAKQ